jgi:hypothetical protein
MQQVRSYLDDIVHHNDTTFTFAGDSMHPGVNQFSGSYVGSEHPGGILSGGEYYRAYRESELARMAPDVLAKSVRSTWDEPFLSLITPDKPAAVSLAGYDVFGPHSFHTTTRNMTLDLRGEAAYAPEITGEVPHGASISSLAHSGGIDFARCNGKNGCPPNAFKQSVAPATCRDRCMNLSKTQMARSQCLSKCPNKARANFVSDSVNECKLRCKHNYGNTSHATSCSTDCDRYFSSPVGGSRVKDVFPSKMFSNTHPYHI